MSSKVPFKSYASITAVLLVLVMTVLDGTVMNVALPVIAANFRISDAQSVWIVTAYQLVITMLLLPVSSLGDLFSYRKAFLVGVSVFTIASIACAMSYDFTTLVVSRSLQGIGAACIMGVNIALTRLIYPKEILAKGLALNAAVIAVSTAAGPTLAGVILSTLSWHWLFIINVPLGLIALIVGFKLLPENARRSDDVKYDWVSAIENMIVFGLIFYSIGSISRNGDATIDITLFIVAVSVAFFYVRRQLNKQHPLLPIDLFRIPVFTLTLTTSTCSFIAQTMAMVALPFLFLNRYGFSEVTTGLLMTPWPLMTMLMAPVAAKLIEKMRPDLTATCGMAIFCAGLVTFTLLPVSGVSEWNIAWRMALCGFGFGIFQTPNNVVMVTATPLSRTGGAGGLQSTARLVGQTLGATFVSLIFAIVSSDYSVHVALIMSATFAAVSAIFSLSRKSQVNS